MKTAANPAINYVISLLVNTLAVFATAYVLAGVSVDSFITAFVVAIILGTVNTFIRPLLLLVTLPLTILTFGVFALVINAGLILLVGMLVPGFTVVTFWWALAFGLVLALVSSFLQQLHPRL